MSKCWIIHVGSGLSPRATEDLGWLVIETTLISVFPEATCSTADAMPLEWLLTLTVEEDDRNVCSRVSCFNLCSRKGDFPPVRAELFIMAYIKHQEEPSYYYNELGHDGGTYVWLHTYKKARGETKCRYKSCKNERRLREFASPASKCPRKIKEWCVQTIQMTNILYFYC